MPQATITIGSVIAEPLEGQGISTSATIVVEGDMIIAGSPVIPGSTANVEVEVAFDTARLKFLELLSDQDVTVYTNNAGGDTPDDTIPILAGKPWLWYLGGGIDIDDLIVGDSGVVNKLFISRGAAGNATVKIRGLKDGTPGV